MKATRPANAVSIMALMLASGLLAGCADSPWSEKNTRLDTDPVLRIAGTMEKQGNTAMAAQFYARAAELDKDNPRPLIELAHIAQSGGANDSAIEYYRKAIGLDGTNYAVREDMARLLVAQGRAAEARDQYRIIIDATGGDAKTFSALGVALDMQGLHGEAQEQYRRALAKDPSSGNTISNLAHSLTLSNKPREAIALLAPLVSAPGASPLMKQNLAQAKLYDGDDAGARETLLASGMAQDQATKTIAAWNQERSGGGKTAPGASAGEMHELPVQVIEPRPENAAPVPPPEKLVPAVSAPKAQEAKPTQAGAKAERIVPAPKQPPAAKISESVGASLDADLGLFKTPEQADARIAAARKSAKNPAISFTKQATEGGARVLATGFGTLDDVQDFCDALEAANMTCGLTLGGE